MEAKNIKIEGIYTHLSSADCDEDYTKKQLDSFKYSVAKAAEKFDVSPAAVAG